MFTPKTDSGKWIMLIVFLYLGWLTINHPAEAVNLFETIISGIGQLFNAVFTVSQSAGSDV